jgi:hypothetical protein
MSLKEQLAALQADGRRVSSAELLDGGPMMLSFFRGSW